MRNVEKERLINKLKLWETPGFSQFLNDLSVYIDNKNLVNFADALKIMYQNKLKEIDTDPKQTKLKI